MLYMKLKKVINVPIIAQVKTMQSVYRLEWVMFASAKSILIGV